MLLPVRARSAHRTPSSSLPRRRKNVSARSLVQTESALRYPTLTDASTGARPLRAQDSVFLTPSQTKKRVRSLTRPDKASAALPDAHRCFYRFAPAPRTGLRLPHSLADEKTCLLAHSSRQGRRCATRRSPMLLPVRARSAHRTPSSSLPRRRKNVSARSLVQTR